MSENASSDVVCLSKPQVNRSIRLPEAGSGQDSDPSIETVAGDLAVPTRCVQDMSHLGEGNVVLAISQFSHNLSVSLNNTNAAKNLKLTQVEHACSCASGCVWLVSGAFSVTLNQR